MYVRDLYDDPYAPWFDRSIGAWSFWSARMVQELKDEQAYYRAVHAWETLGELRP